MQIVCFCPTPENFALPGKTLADAHGCWKKSLISNMDFSILKNDSLEISLHDMEISILILKTRPRVCVGAGGG